MQCARCHQCEGLILMQKNCPGFKPLNTALVPGGKMVGRCMLVADERAAIVVWLQDHDTSPMSRQQVTSLVFPNLAVRQLIQGWHEVCATQTIRLLRFAFVHRPEMSRHSRQLGLAHDRSPSSPTDMQSYICKAPFCSERLRLHCSALTCRACTAPQA